MLQTGISFFGIRYLWHNLKDKEISNEATKAKLEHLKQRITENEFFYDDDSFEPDQEIFRFLVRLLHLDES